MKTLKFSPLFIAVVFLILLSGGWVLWVEDQARTYQTELGPEIERQFGFVHGTPYISAGENRIEVLTVHPVPGGRLARAGFMAGDIVISENISSFYKLLHESGDTAISIDVVNGGDGAPIQQRSIRTLIVNDKN